ncbi:MAG: MBL fold metallo-hydrolase [Bacteroidetes bacterium]|nr:MBL fold metallo-hydrolase [Bacteroidota bacterium]
MKRNKIKKIMKINVYLVLLIAAVVTISNQSCSSATYIEGDSKLSKIEKSSNFRDGKFQNKVAWEQPGIGSMLSTMWDFIFMGNDRSPGDSLPIMKVDLTEFNRKDGNQLNSTWLGHSSLMINIDGYKILTDPVFEKSMTFFGPSRYNGEIPLDINELEQIDVVIISHNHYDHMNIKSIKRLNEKSDRFIVPLAVGAELENAGVPREKITELDWWDEIKINEDLMIAATPAQHFSGRGITDRNETLWASWVIEGPNHKVFFSGDGGYSEGFKVIGEKYGPFNMTFMESGAYNEKWHHIHMYPEETVQAHIDLKGEVLHPIHWATFNLALHPWYEPMDRLVNEAWGKNVKVSMPIVGETTIYDKYIPTKLWWEEFMNNDNIIVTE